MKIELLSLRLRFVAAAINVFCAMVACGVMLSSCTHSTTPSGGNNSSDSLYGDAFLQSQDGIPAPSNAAVTITVDGTSMSTKANSAGIG